MKRFIGCFKFNKNAINAFAVCFFFIIFLSFGFYGVVAKSVSKFNGIVIVLDAGHGARDGGSVGANGTIEKDINLVYTLALKDKLVSLGYRVELTRKDDNPLYALTAKNKKLSDMNARFDIIKRANPNLVISIHMNSFKDKSAHGATTYYRADDEASRLVADYIQKCFHEKLEAPNIKSKVGDYFILNCSYYTAVLIECGFISNPSEEANLNSKDYQNRLVDAVCDAIMLYFGNASMVA